MGDSRDSYNSKSYEILGNNGYGGYGGTDSVDMSYDEPVIPDRSLMKMPQAHASWVTAGQLMVADVVGVGVLTISSAVAGLGWYMGVA